MDIICRPESGYIVHTLPYSYEIRQAGDPYITPGVFYPPPGPPGQAFYKPCRRTYQLHTYPTYLLPSTFASEEGYVL